MLNAPLEDRSRAKEFVELHDQVQVHALFPEFYDVSNVHTLMLSLHSLDKHNSPGLARNLSLYVPKRFVCRVRADLRLARSQQGHRESAKEQAGMFFLVYPWR